MMKDIIRTSVSLFLFLSAAFNVHAADVNVKDPVVREAPPGMQVLAAYMTLVNNGTQDVTLVGAESGQFARIEMHNVITKDGMARMVPMEKADVAAGKSFVFQQGGKHLMLFEPAKALHEGDSVDIRLLFSDKTSMDVQFQVKKMTMPAGMNHMHHNMDHK